MSSPNHMKTEREHITSWQKQQSCWYSIISFMNHKITFCYFNYRDVQGFLWRGWGKSVDISPLSLWLFEDIKTKMNKSNINSNNYNYLNQILLFYPEHKRWSVKMFLNSLRKYSAPHPIHNPGTVHRGISIFSCHDPC